MIDNIIWWVGAAVLMLGGVLLITYLLYFVADRTWMAIRCWSFIIDYALHRKQFRKWMREKNIRSVNETPLDHRRQS